MHQAILSEKERLIIKEYLETGTKQEGFRVLKYRITQFKKTIDNDHALLTRLLEKTDAED